MPQYLPSQEQSIPGSQALPMGRQRAVPHRIQNCLLVLGMVICYSCSYLLVSYLSMARKTDIKLSSPLAGLGLVC